jgi:hypothetical protein
MPTFLSLLHSDDDSNDEEEETNLCAAGNVLGFNAFSKNVALNMFMVNFNVYKASHVRELSIMRPLFIGPDSRKHFHLKLYGLLLRMIEHLILTTGCSSGICSFDLTLLSTGCDKIFVPKCTECVGNKYVDKYYLTNNGRSPMTGNDRSPSKVKQLLRMKNRSSLTLTKFRFAINFV